VRRTCVSPRTRLFYLERLTPHHRLIVDYVKELVELGYLKYERAKVRGNVRTFFV
jgi:hypothetical protein